MEGLIILGIILAIYWTPTFIAFERNVSSPMSVGAINLFLGWTLIGWVVALALALRTPMDKEPPVTRPVANDPSVVALDRLVSLRSQGLLSDSEFVAAKAKLLTAGDVAQDPPAAGHT